MCPAVDRAVVTRASKSNIRSSFVPDYYQEEVSVCSSNEKRMDDWVKDTNRSKVKVDHDSNGFVSLLTVYLLN